MNNEIIIKKISFQIWNYKKAKELYETWYCHFCYSSPWRWQNNTSWYHYNKKENKLYRFGTKWYWDNKTRDNFFKNWFTNSKKEWAIYNLI